MTRTLLVRNKQPQHSLPGIADKQTSSAEKIRRKRATVASYSMLYRFLCNALQRASQKIKKYGANAPQLHHISFAPAWGAVPGQGAKGKNKKIRRKRATVAPYSRKNSPGNRLSTRWARAIMKKLEL